MTTFEAKDFNCIGVNDDAAKGLSRDEAQSLLRIFANQDAETRTLGALLISTPNGKDLYVTPRLYG